jgi:hypothetical protein
MNFYIFPQVASSEYYLTTIGTVVLMMALFPMLYLVVRLTVFAAREVCSVLRLLLQPLIKLRDIDSSISLSSIPYYYGHTSAPAEAAERNNGGGRLHED